MSGLCNEMKQPFDQGALQFPLSLRILNGKHGPSSTYALGKPE